MSWLTEAFSDTQRQALHQGDIAFEAVVQEPGAPRFVEHYVALEEAQ